MSGDFNTVLDYSEFFANFRLNNNYSLITKCEYINFNNFSNSDEYVQPIMGYVPFIIKKERYIN